MYILFRHRPLRGRLQVGVYRYNRVRSSAALEAATLISMRELSGVLRPRTAVHLHVKAEPKPRVVLESERVIGAEE